MPHPNDPASWDYRLDPPEHPEPACIVCGDTQWPLDLRDECGRCRMRRCRECDEVAELDDDRLCGDCGSW